MYTKLISSNSANAVIQITIPLGSQMLEGESLIQDAINEAGAVTPFSLMSVKFSPAKNFFVTAGKMATPMTARRPNMISSAI